MTELKEYDILCLLDVYIKMYVGTYSEDDGKHFFKMILKYLKKLRDFKKAEINKKMGKKFFYLVVNNDEYELPVCAGDIRRVAKFLQCSEKTLYTAFHRLGDGFTINAHKYRVYRIQERDLEQ